MKVGHVFIVNRRGQNRGFTMSLFSISFSFFSREEEQDWNMYLQIL